jgi:hypothetical protein
MAFEPIHSAPKDGNFVVLRDASAYDVGRWSVEKSDWVRVTGEPVQVQPTHWMLLRSASSLPLSFDALGRERGRKRIRSYAAGLALVALLLVCVSSIRHYFPAIPATFRGVAGGSEAPAIDSPSGGDGAQTQARSREQTAASEGKRQRTESLFREVRAGRAEIEALRARLASLSAALRQAQTAEAERTYAHERQRLRADALSRELEAARAEIESMKTKLALTNTSATLLPSSQSNDVQQRQQFQNNEQPKSDVGMGEPAKRDAATVKVPRSIGPY